MSSDDNGHHENGLHRSGVKSSMGGTGKPEKASPAAVEHSLKGIRFPATKHELLDHAKENHAPHDVMTVLKKFGEKEYNSVIDISKEVGRIE